MNIKNKYLLFIAAIAAMPYSTTSQAYEFEVGDAKVKVGGYIKLDAIHDLDADLGHFVIPQRIRLDDVDGPDGHTEFHAYQSRIGFQTSTPVENSDLVTNIEWDMFGEGGGEPRLRHAYGSWNKILAGQSWTNFVSDGALGQMRKINFIPEAGANPSRQAQLRYTVGHFSVAAEDPEKIGKQAIGSGAKNEYPDFTARYQSKYGNLNYSAAAVVRVLGYDSAGIQASADDDTAFAWGVNVEGAYQLSSAVMLRGSLKYGDGVGGYIASNPAAPGYVDPVSGSLETISTFGGTASISIGIGKGAVNFGYGFAKADLDDAIESGVLSASTANEKFESMHLNYIWSPAKRISYGVEVSYHTREVFSGAEGDATRLQAMVKYNF